MIITMDGPAGSGKSTAARNLAEALGVAFLDTGATYRAVTLKAMREGVPLTDPAAMADAAARMDLQMRCERGGVRVRMDGRDVTEEIRASEVTANSRYAATPGEVRRVLVGLQRRLGAALGDFVSEGRDQGSAVFPDADVKFYLTASADVRARRRCEELRARGEAADVEAVKRAILERDHRDSTRSADPLVRPDGAIEVDTDGKTPEQVRDELLAHVEALR